MTKYEVIELAKQAGFADGVVEIVGLYGFMKFAHLVAAVEREECANVCEQLAMQQDSDAWDATYAIRARSEK